MIIFPHLRTRRLAVRLRELTLGEAIAVCKLPAGRHELTTTEFLRFVASDAQVPQERYITDPRLWSVEERTLLVCHYLAQVSDDGPDFAVGQSSKFTDFVVFDADLAADQVDMGVVAGKSRVMRPLIGLQAEILERACTDRGEWLIGAMACQLLPVDEPAPPWADMSDTQALEWVKAQSDAIRALPESDFEALLLAYSAGARQMYHFFSTSFDDEGIVCEASAGEAGNKNPARFLAVSCISGAARRLFGRSDHPGR
jgi:hypothetical protein